MQQCCRSAGLGFQPKVFTIIDRFQFIFSAIVSFTQLHFISLILKMIKMQMIFIQIHAILNILSDGN